MDDSSIGAKYIDVAIGFLGHSDKFVDSSFLGHVANERFATDLIGDISHQAILYVGDDNAFCILGSELAGQGCTDTPGGAGDDARLIFQLHGCSLGLARERRLTSGKRLCQSSVDQTFGRLLRPRLG